MSLEKKYVFIYYLRLVWFMGVVLICWGLIDVEIIISFWGYMGSFF